MKMAAGAFSAAAAAPQRASKLANCWLYFKLLPVLTYAPVVVDKDSMHAQPKIKQSHFLYAIKVLNYQEHHLAVTPFHGLFRLVPQ